MQKAINRLHRQILAGVNQGGGALGALVIVGSVSAADHGSVTSFSGGNTAPIVSGLVKEMRRDPNAIYCVQRVETDLPEYRQYNNCWGVCRHTTNRGFMFCTTIKVFTDEDDDFNLREAEELCEMLNSK